jgi:hypothetical protein
MKINKSEKLHNKHNEIYYDRRVLSKNCKYPTKYAKWNTYGAKKM